MQNHSKESAMKKEFSFSSVLMLIFLALSLVGCKKEQITISSNEFWFPGEASVQEILLTANCGWTISIDDGADWYTIRECIDKTVGATTVSIIYDTTKVVTSGSGDMALAIVVQPIENVLTRSSSFTITSAKGNVQVKVRISQNTEEPIELQSITNMVFGVTNVAHWNVDFFGQVIEDSYISLDFNPADTTQGFFMYFLEDGQGVQRDNEQDSTVYYLFTYDYDPIARNLHVEFETVADTVAEVYDAPILSATEESFLFCHEYKPKFWERANMQKVATIEPQEKAILQRKAKKREGGEPIFKF